MMGVRWAGNAGGGGEGDLDIAKQFSQINDACLYAGLYVQSVNLFH